MRNKVLDDIAAEMKALLKDVKKAATSGLTMTKGGAPRKTYKEAGEVHGELENYTRTQLGLIESLRSEEVDGDAAEDEEGVDTDALDEHEFEKMQNSRAAPAEWGAYADGVDLRVEIDMGGEEEDPESRSANRTPSEEDRLAFLQAIIQKVLHPFPLVLGIC